MPGSAAFLPAEEVGLPLLEEGAPTLASVVGEAWDRDNRLRPLHRAVEVQRGGAEGEHLADLLGNRRAGFAPQGVYPCAGSDRWIAISVVEGAEQADVEAAMAAVSAQFPAADVEATEEFQDRAVGVIDDVLTMVNIMVALAVIIALIGIANTLALSVFERTRELGLVRAVGMTKRQLRRMVRFEAALVATFGAVLGVSVGLLFGWGVVQALPASFASTLAIPVQSIAVLMVVAAIAVQGRPQRCRETRSIHASPIPSSSSPSIAV